MPGVTFLLRRNEVGPLLQGDGNKYLPLVGWKLVNMEVPWCGHAPITWRGMLWAVTLGTCVLFLALWYDLVRVIKSLQAFIPVDDSTLLPLRRALVQGEAGGSFSWEVWDTLLSSNMIQDGCRCLAPAWEPTLVSKITASPLSHHSRSHRLLLSTSFRCVETLLFSWDAQRNESRARPDPGAAIFDF